MYEYGDMYTQWICEGQKINLNVGPHLIPCLRQGPLMIAYGRLANQ